MKYNLSCKIYGCFFHKLSKPLLKEKGVDKNRIKAVKDEYKSIILRAKDIGHSKLILSYIMAAYFIALTRKTDLSPEENYELFKAGLFNSKLFHKAMGDADSYLNPKNMKWRKEWEKESHQKKYENDWVVDVLDKTCDYELGYNYHECGVCKLCRDENCPELAKYLCRLDFPMADMMGLQLIRTKTLAEGGDYCDFRYKRKK